MPACPTCPTCGAAVTDEQHWTFRDSSGGEWYAVMPVGASTAGAKLTAAAALLRVELDLYPPRFQEEEDDYSAALDTAASGLTFAYLSDPFPASKDD